MPQLSRNHWTTTSPIPTILKKAFENTGLPYHNPHGFRNTLAQLGERLCQGAEQFKAWSQNLGHEKVMTTFVSYGVVQPNRQAEIIRNLNGSGDPSEKESDVLRQQTSLLMPRSGLLTLTGRNLPPGYQTARSAVCLLLCQRRPKEVTGSRTQYLLAHWRRWSGRKTQRGRPPLVGVASAPKGVGNGVRRKWFRPSPTARVTRPSVY